MLTYKQNFYLTLINFFPISCNSLMELYVNNLCSGLREFLANENPLKLMKNTFYFTLNNFFVLKIKIFLSLIFGNAEERLD